MTDTTGSADTAGNSATTTADTTTTTTAADAPWYGTFEDAALRGLVETKGFKTPEALAGSYRDLEKHLGVPADRLLKLPEAADDPAWGGIRAKLGFAPPAKAEDYGITAPEGADPSFATEAAKWMLDAGMTKDQAVKMSGHWNAYATAMEQQQTAARQQQEQADLTQLKQDWGQQFDTSVEMGRRAARELGTVAGMTEGDLNELEGAVGTAKFVKLFAAIGSKNLAEAPIDGTTGTDGARTGFMSPDAAKARIESLKGDPAWGAELLKEMDKGNGNGPKQQEWNRLHRIASGAAA